MRVRSPFDGHLKQFLHCTATLLRCGADIREMMLNRSGSWQKAQNRPKSLFSAALHARPEHPDHNDDDRYRPENIGDCGVIPHHLRAAAAQPRRHGASEQKEQSADQPDLKIDIQDACPQAQYVPWCTKAKGRELAIVLPCPDALCFSVGKCASPFGHNAFAPESRVRV
jgi:hypothetical protein